jgi:hypothetical protein
MLEAKWGVAAGSSDIGVVPIIGRIVVMFPRLFVVMCGLVFGFAEFGSDPAFANGYHRKAGSCRGCNLPPSNVVNTHKVVDHTRVVHHTKVVPHTRVVNHDKLVLHKHNVHHRHTTIHKTNVVHREIVLHRHNTFHRRATAHAHFHHNRYVTRHTRTVEHRHVRGGDFWCNCGAHYASGH